MIVILLHGRQPFGSMVLALNFTPESFSSHLPATPCLRFLSQPILKQQSFQFHHHLEPSFDTGSQKWNRHLNGKIFSQSELFSKGSAVSLKCYRLYVNYT